MVMKKSILSIDDSSATRRIIMSYLGKLRDEGYELFEASNGIEALSLIRSGEMFDLFLVDIEMPKMDGFTFIKELRKFKCHSQTPFIFLTGRDKPQDVVSGLTLGAEDYIVK